MVEIPTYQIHKVMKVYSKQLNQAKMLERKKTQTPKTAFNRINISAEGKRQAIIDKVAADVVERITSVGPRDEFDREIVDKLQEEISSEIDFKKSQKSKFVFNVIDENNVKATNSLSVEDSRFLVNRLEQLAKDAVDKNMES